jgi:hypothetical protein
MKNWTELLLLVFLNTVDIHVPTRQIREYSTTTDSNATASAKCSIDAKSTGSL